MTGDKNCGDVEGDEAFASPSADSEEYRTSDHNIGSNVTDGNELHPTRSRASALAVTQSIWRRTYETIYWTPERLRWDPDNAPKFSIGLNVLFGFAGAFTVANLYYNHPILNILARDFHVPYVKVADIPTLAQAGCKSHNPRAPAKYNRITNVTKMLADFSSYVRLAICSRGGHSC